MGDTFASSSLQICQRSFDSLGSNSKAFKRLSEYLFMRQLTWFVQGGLSTPPHPTSKLRKECRKKRKRRVEIEGFFGPFSKATFKGALLKDPTVYYNSPPGRKADELLHSNTMQGNCFLLLLSSCSGITGLVASQNKTNPESETIQHIPKLFILRCAVPMRRSKMKELDV